MKLAYLTLTLAFSNYKSSSTNTKGNGDQSEEIRGRAYLEELNERAYQRHKLQQEASWNYATNITDTNLQNKITVQAKAAIEEKEDWEKTIKFNWKSFEDEDLRRQFKFYSVLGTCALPEDKFKKNTKIIGDMSNIYSSSKVCDKHSCTLSLEPDLEDIFANSRNSDKLRFFWLAWRNAVGPKVRPMYQEYVDLQNEIARLNNFKDNTAMWLEDFESSDFREQLRNIWEQVRPLYLQLHAYVRYQLRKSYGKVVTKTGPIPAHLLGNMWAQKWRNIADITLPYPNESGKSVKEEMLLQGYTPKKMFEAANDFFVNLNLTAMPPMFWKKSIIEKPTDGRDLVCHASAWDFYDGDVRIKQCTTVAEPDFYTVHHEMGHVEYYLQYKDQPQIYRTGANSGFHEAVGDTVALSISTTEHMAKMGLLQSNENDEQNINMLFRTGLEKIAMLPFSYLVDLWRWDVFSGKTPTHKWNCNWWKLRHEYQGIEPPVPRSENDFDPAAKYHIAANVPYIRYYVSNIIQFQFYRALCMEAKQYDPNDSTKPLHKCNIDNNADAGNLLKKMLSMGRSRPWPDAMEVITGQRDMNANAILEYFKPLQLWLEDYNKKHNVHVGWGAPTHKCGQY